MKFHFRKIHEQVTFSLFLLNGIAGEILKNPAFFIISHALMSEE